MVAALVLGLINTLIRPILILLTLPATILTLGLFIFVINGLLFWFVGSFVLGFTVDGFWTARARCRRVQHHLVGAVGAAARAQVMAGEARRARALQPRVLSAADAGGHGEAARRARASSRSSSPRSAR